MCFLPLSAHEEMGRGNVLMLVPPEGFYGSIAAGLESEIRNKENQRGKGVAIKEFIVIP